mgnify:CR=1 FL=1
MEFAQENHSLSENLTVWQRFTALLALAAPVMLEQLGQILLGTVDTYFAGQLGDDAIAAINAANLFSNLYTSVFVSLGLGVIIMVGHALGAGDHVLANRVMRQTILFSSGICVLLGTASVLLRHPLLYAVGARGDILSMGSEYYAIVCGPCILSCLTIVLSYGLKAAQNTKASMRAAIAANVLNAVLDAVFIKLGMGVFGLGLATTLARLLNVLLLLRLYFKGVTVLRLDKTLWEKDFSLIKELISYSLPIMLTQFSTRLVILVHGSMVLYLGSTYYVANSITLAIDEYACIPSAGYEAAAATMVSQSLGAGKPRSAVAYTRLSCVGNVVFMTLIGAFLAVFALPLAGIFTETAEICNMVRQILVFMVFFDWTSSLSHVFTSAVQATGDAKYPLYVTIGCDIVMRLGVGCLLAFVLGWNLMGIWVGIVLDFLGRTILLSRRFRSRFREPAPTIE